MRDGPTEPVILDPSVLFERGVTDELFSAPWPGLRISRALARLLGNPDSLHLLEEFGTVPSKDDAQRVLTALNGHSFSWREVELTGEAADVRDRLLAAHEPLSDVYADEWVFLVSQSWGVFRAIQDVLQGVPRTIEEFKKAKARAVELTRKQMDQLRKDIVAQTPEPLRKDIKKVGKLSKPGATLVLGLGGIAATAAWPFLLGVVAGLELVPPAAAFIYGDP